MAEYTPSIDMSRPCRDPYRFSKSQHCCQNPCSRFNIVFPSLVYPDFELEIEQDEIRKALLIHRQPKRTICGFGLQRSFGRNILELLVYYLMQINAKS